MTNQKETTDAMLQRLCDGIFMRDAEAVKNEFRYDDVSKIEDFDESVEKLFDYIEGDFEGFERIAGGSEEKGWGEPYEYGVFRSCRYQLNTTTDTYKIIFDYWFHYRVIGEEKDENKIGIELFLRIFSKELFLFGVEILHIRRLILEFLHEDFFRFHELDDGNLRNFGNICTEKFHFVFIFRFQKIHDIFAGVGLTESKHTNDNQDGMDVTFDYMKQDNKGIIYTNLVEFDSTWGHRRDYKGYARGLEEFDDRLAQVLDTMKDTDMLVITADHGCDPTYKGTDHTREYVPLLVYGKCLKHGVNLGTGDTYADIAQTLAEIFIKFCATRRTYHIHFIIHTYFSHFLL